MTPRPVVSKEKATHLEKVYETKPGEPAFAQFANEGIDREEVGQILGYGIAAFYGAYLNNRTENNHA